MTAARLETLEQGDESPTLEEIGRLAVALRLPTLTLLASFDLCSRERGADLLHLILDQKDADLRSAKRLLEVIFQEYALDGEEPRARRKPPTKKPSTRLRLAD